MAADPIGLTGGIKVYGYVGGNPVNNLNPTGQFAAVEILWREAIK